MAKRAKRRHEQTSIPGTDIEVPTVVRDAVHKWLDDCDAARQVSKRKKMSHDVMLQHMAEAGIERAPYVDAVTGKKKHVYADKTAKAKVINAPRGSSSAKNENVDRERPDIDVEITDPNADKVESRRVSRESVEREIGPLDPFANTRNLMDKADGPATEH